MRFLSPALLVQSAFCDLAGTGPARHDQFKEAVRGFQRQWRDFFLPRSFAKQRLRAADIDALPSFEFPDENLAALSQRVGSSLFGLLASVLLPALLTLPLTRKTAAARRDFAELRS